MSGLSTCVSIAALLALGSSEAVGRAGNEPYADCASAAELGNVPDLKRAIVGEAARNLAPEQTIKFFDDNTVLVARTDLSPGRKTVVVYLTGSLFCGSGGCNAYIFEDAGDAATARYRLHARIAPARIPIASLKSSQDGWRDLGVTVAGGGIAQAYMAKLATAKGPRLENPTLEGVAHVAPQDVQSILIDRPGLSSQQCRLT